MLFGIMDKKQNDLRPICKRIMSEKWKYKQDTLKWLHSTMESMSQEELIEQLDDLSYKELSMCLGAGIHGDAYRFATDKKHKMNKAVKARLEKIYDTATVSTKVDVPPEVEDDDEERVQTFKEGRKSHR